ncbi:unnamed protein product [Amoebophrya sp. A25]|nr:unnamed protein product [Amoebophrya sp. A25]|eukprot:GSA25T00011058001.1
MLSGRMRKGSGMELQASRDDVASFSSRGHGASVSILDLERYPPAKSVRLIAQKTTAQLLVESKINFQRFVAGESLVTIARRKTKKKRRGKVAALLAAAEKPCSCSVSGYGSKIEGSSSTSTGVINASGRDGAPTSTPPTGAGLTSVAAFFRAKPGKPLVDASSMDVNKMGSGNSLDEKAEMKNASEELIPVESTNKNVTSCTAEQTEVHNMENTALAPTPTRIGKTQDGGVRITNQTHGEQTCSTTRESGDKQSPGEPGVRENLGRASSSSSNSASSTVGSGTSTSRKKGFRSRDHSSTNTGTTSIDTHVGGPFVCDADTVPARDKSGRENHAALQPVASNTKLSTAHLTSTTPSTLGAAFLRGNQDPSASSTMYGAGTYNSTSTGVSPLFPISSGTLGASTLWPFGGTLSTSPGLQHNSLFADSQLLGQQHIGAGSWPSAVLGSACNSCTPPLFDISATAFGCALEMTSANTSAPAATATTAAATSTTAGQHQAGSSYLLTMPTAEHEHATSVQHQGLFPIQSSMPPSIDTSSTSQQTLFPNLMLNPSAGSFTTTATVVEQNKPLVTSTTSTVHLVLDDNAQQSETHIFSSPEGATEETSTSTSPSTAAVIRKFLCTFIVGIGAKPPFNCVERLLETGAMSRICNQLPYVKIRLRGTNASENAWITDPQTGTLVPEDPVQINVSVLHSEEAYLRVKTRLSLMLYELYDEFYKFSGTRVSLRLQENPRNPVCAVNSAVKCQ